MKYLLLMILASTFLLNSCITSTSVTVVSHKKPIKVYIDDELKGEGDSVSVDAGRFRSYYNRYISKNLRVESDSCKPFNAAILSGISDKYVFENFDYFSYWDSTKKGLYLEEVTIEVADSNYTFNQIFYQDYLEKDEGNDNYWIIDDEDVKNKKSDDSVTSKKPFYDDRLFEILKETKYIDTTKTIFVDNINTSFVSCNIREIFTHYIDRDFIVIDISSEWSLTDIYGDTLYVERISSSSGEFSLNPYINSKYYSDAIEDAIVDGYYNFSKLPEFDKFLKLESREVSYDNLKMTKPASTPSSIKESMRASVTIKNDDGHGSGFAISQDGYIITNYHVVANHKDLVVVTYDDIELDYELIRVDKFHDIALIKVDHEFEYAYEIPTSENFDIAEDVVAIGTPKSVELGQSVSKGIVSGSRKKNDIEIIQTDASINGGNSGGALAKTNGELVGIIQFKMIGFGTEGISFAIPAYLIIDGLKLAY
jgi:S1-C subfamily serine protease